MDSCFILIGRGLGNYMSMEADRTRADLMFTAVKNQLRVSLLSVKYNMMREMVNKVTFVTNIIFMMLNNATILVCGNQLCP